MQLQFCIQHQAHTLYGLIMYGCVTGAWDFHPTLRAEPEDIANHEFQTTMLSYSPTQLVCHEIFGPPLKYLDRVHNRNREIYSSCAQWG